MNAQELTQALKGIWHGSYGTARCPSHQDKNPSLSISDGMDGKVLVRCHSGCDQGAVWEVLTARGLVGRQGGTDKWLTNSAHGQHLKAAKKDDDIARTAWALAKWGEGKPAAGTLVQEYLRSRSITIEPPASLRYHLGMKHGPTRLVFPVMVAAVQNVNRAIVAIHRTFLRLDGQGKAAVDKPKMMLGPCTGGAVRFAPAAPELVLSEGIESGLSVMQASGLPTWATLSSSGLKGVILPPEVTSIIIAADNDETGIEAAEEAAARFIREGRKVKIAKPPDGLDFNDLLQKPENVIPFPIQKESA